MNLREVTQALHKGYDIRWISDLYHVQWATLPDGPAITITHKNGSSGAMADTEVSGCYIMETTDE